MSALHLQLPDAAATEALGAALADVLRTVAGGVVFLHGELGAGKTTLARGLLRALGVQGAVRSPTYTLLEPYVLDGIEVLHMDLYRLADATELDQLGLDGYPPERVLWLVEWPERADGTLGAPLLDVRLSATGDGRRAILIPAEQAPATLVARLMALASPE